ncbi:hypothetical protein M0R45_005136 [Rubus argutus]|uniref:Serine-threonine/tyrosine-protein kinase catalytic domain-containing protein n=1 Tax=Rubus argutus TaxID=59490 RepID=A0AAW1YLV0_RUBAR
MSLYLTQVLTTSYLIQSSVHNWIGITVTKSYGYMAPEYAMHGHFSVKSDVYSFGVFDFGDSKWTEKIVVSVVEKMWRIFQAMHGKLERRDNYKSNRSHIEEWFKN